MAPAHPAHQTSVGILFVGRFTLLLTALVLILAVFPFVEGRPHWFVLVRFLFSIVLLSALLLSSGKRWTIWVATLLFFPALVIHWYNFFAESYTIAVIDGCLAIAVFAVIAGSILGFVFRTRQVTYETIGGALCVYLLIGLIGASTFALIELVQPKSFRLVEPAHLYGAHLVFGELGHVQFVYYSFATLTTLGIGDIVPLTDPARTFSYMEAVAGQFYLTVLVARLVGLHIAQPSSAR
jgi:hypothetical protein